jgi:RimJ/RimL family protein N-acetyltransferase
MDELRHRFAWRRRRSVDDDGVEHMTTRAVGDLMREGERVRLRRHVPENRAAFQRWYADEEIARLLRHDQRPLNEIQSRGYFDTLILPSSARGQCYAIHEADTDRLIGTTALTDFEGNARRRAYFRIVIGEKEFWGHGYGTEATDLVMHEAFERHGLSAVKLEVFRHNDRAARAYLRVGFEQTGEHTEWVGRERWELHVLEMELTRERYAHVNTMNAALEPRG